MTTRHYLLVLVAAGLVACGGPFAPPAATVGDREISATRVEELLDRYAASQAFKQQAEQGDEGSLKRGLEQSILSQFIRDAVLTPRAADLGIDITEQDVEDRIDQLREENDLTNPATFEEFLKEQGLTLGQLGDLARITVLEERLRAEVAGRVEPSDRDVRAEYEERVAAGQYRETRAEHILVDSRREANRLAKRLERAAPARVEALFSELARTFSKDKQSARKGGDLGFAAPGLFVPEFDAVLDALQIGEISEPTRTEAGWHIIRVTARRSESFGDVRASLATQLREGIQDEAWARWLQDAYEAADIEVNPRYGVLDLASQQIVDPSASDYPGAGEPENPQPQPTGS